MVAYRLVMRCVNADNTHDYLTVIVIMLPLTPPAHLALT